MGITFKLIQKSIFKTYSALFLGPHSNFKKGYTISLDKRKFELTLCKNLYWNYSTKINEPKGIFFLT